MSLLTPINAGTLNFAILSYENNENSTPYSVRRFSDDEVFTVGDFVSNGTKIKGKILAFNLYTNTDGNLMMFVETDWSKVGMGLDDIFKLVITPSKFQVMETVSVHFGQENPDGDVPVRPMAGKVLAVHFYKDSHKNSVRIKYDVEIKIAFEESTRIYNIDEKFLWGIGELEI
jgi:hypothetical protein